MQLPETYTKAAVLYIAREAEDVCRRDGCASPAVVAFTFLSDDGADVDESFVFLCRTHMHGFLGHFLDHGESVEVDE